MSISSYDINGNAGAPGTSFGVSNAAYPEVYPVDRAREMAAANSIHHPDTKRERAWRERMKYVDALRAQIVRPTPSSVSPSSNRDGASHDRS